jgi:ABC-type polysaccharide/polyol phosphate export permease
MFYFFSPIIYPRSALPESAHAWLNMNPMYHLIEIFRAPIYSGVQAGLYTWLAASGVALGAMLIGWYFFTARAEKIIYQI